MFYIKDKSYSKSLIIISLLILLSIYLSIFNPIYNYNLSRIYNLTKVPDIYRVSLLNTFLDKQYVENSILILGDSQPNGFRYPDKYIFSTILAKQLNRKVINAAFQDARIDDTIYTLEYLKNKNMQFRTMIFNVNPVHIEEPFQHRLQLNNSVDYKIGIFKNSNNFEDFSNNFNPTSTPSITFYKSPGLPNFFAMTDKALNLYLLRLRELIIIAKDISKQVIIYGTPYYVEDSKKLKRNSVTINKLEEKVLNICKEHNVTFLKPAIIEKEYFNDIVHFNAKGHIKMAEILYQVIKK